MAYTVARKSTLITNLDATPVVRATAGQAGGWGRVQRMTQTFTITSGDDSTHYYRIIRVPTNCVVSAVRLGLDATVATLVGSLGYLFSDNATDGTDANAPSSASVTSSQGGGLVSQSFHAYQIDLNKYANIPGAHGGSGATNPTDGTVIQLGQGLVELTFANAAGNSVTDGYYVPSNSQLPLWNAIGSSTGLSTGALYAITSAAPTVDPGGFFDLTFFVTSASTSGAAKVTAQMDIVVPG